MCPAKPCDQGVKGRPVTLLPRRVLLQTHPLRSLPPESFRQWVEATSCPPDGQALICLFTRCTIIAREANPANPLDPDPGHARRAARGAEARRATRRAVRTTGAQDAAGCLGRGSHEEETDDVPINSCAPPSRELGSKRSMKRSGLGVLRFPPTAASCLWRDSNSHA